MKHYEQILDKIAPTFYKTLQYMDYFNDRPNLSLSYLRHAKVLKANYLYLPTNNIYYYYITSHPSKIKIANEYITMLTTKDKRTIYSEVNLAEFIINSIINKFSFENENTAFYVSFTVPSIFKKTFIALVGKDMYDTIRENIR